MRQWQKLSLVVLRTLTNTSMRLLLLLALLIAAYLLLKPESIVASPEPQGLTQNTYGYSATTTPANQRTGTKGIASVSAYNADPNQTDDSPCVTASGYNLCERGGRVVANNCFAFGTKIEIAGHVYEVQDRMNARYDCDHMDIYMEKHEDAKKWGRKRIEVIVID